MTRGMEMFVFMSVIGLDAIVIVLLIWALYDNIKEKREKRIKELAKEMMEEEKTKNE